LLRRAAQAPNVYAKVSGLDVGDADDWSAAELAPYVEHAIDVFGSERLMFGSNWPVAVMRGGYAKVWRETQTALAGLCRMSGITFWAGRRSASTGFPSRPAKDTVSMTRRSAGSQEGTFSE
jgi:L-fuconolactonase